MQDFPPESVTDVLLLPGILTFFGFLGFLLARSAEARKGRIRFGRVIPFIMLTAGLWIGFRWYGKMFGADYPWQLITGGDEFAREIYMNPANNSRKIRLAHHIALFLPLALFSVAAILTFLDFRRFKRRSIVAAA